MIGALGMAFTFEGSQFPEQRRQIAARAFSNHRAAKSMLEGINSQNYWNSWAEISLAVSYQAMIAAGCMGAAFAIAKGIGWFANAVATELTLASQGSAVLNLTVRGTVAAFRGLGQVVGKFATVGKGLKFGQDSAQLINACNGLVARVLVGGVSVLLSEAFNTSGRADGVRLEHKGGKSNLSDRLLIMVALAYLGRPAAPKNTAFLKVFEKLPGIVGAQGVLQASGLVKELSLQVVKGDKMNFLFEAGRHQPKNLETAIEAAGKMTMVQMIEWAEKLEETYIEKIEKKIKDKDSTEQFSGIVRFGMSGTPAKAFNTTMALISPFGIGAKKLLPEDDKISSYNDLFRAMIIFQAKSDFWVRIGKVAMKIEAETRRAKEIAAKASLQTPLPAHEPAEKR